MRNFLKNVAVVLAMFSVWYLAIVVCCLDSNLPMIEIAQGALFIALFPITIPMSYAYPYIGDVGCWVILGVVVVCILWACAKIRV